MNSYPYIPSQSVKDYLNTINRKFTDREIFIISHNNDELSMAEKFKIWKELSDRTSDHYLKIEIGQNMIYERECFREFINNTEDEAYAVVDNYGLIYGHFTDWYSAIAFAKFHAAEREVYVNDPREYRVEKFEIVKDKRPDWENIDKPWGFLSRAYCGVYLNFEGEEKYAAGIFRHDIKVNDDYTKGAVIVPHPFKPGDRVKVAEKHIKWEGSPRMINGTVSDCDEDFYAVRSCYINLKDCRYSDWALPIKFKEYDGDEFIKFIDPIYIEFGD